MKLRMLALAGAAAMALGAGAAHATVIDFDEFTSPPVTCCYADTGVTGPLVYADVTIKDFGYEGSVMNGSGWQNMQTSGQNLFGTLNFGFYFDFNHGVNGLTFDLINGTQASAFGVSVYDHQENFLGAYNFDLTNYGSVGSVAHVVLTQTDIGRVVIDGNEDFAVDTLKFDQTGGVPEPAAWALMIGGFGLAGASLRRRRAATA